VRGVTCHLNGRLIGLPDRIDWLTRWKAALSVSPTTVNGTSRLQESLNKLGANPPLIVNGSFDSATIEAVKAFQQAHGLTPDGKVGPLTTAAIARSLPASS
jgi:peptidoglycan hydrolase-like protein with peptidoglycan-binding domain